MTTHKLTTDTSSYVIGLFKQYQTPALLYHNYDHTQNVVNRTSEIAANYELQKRDRLILTLSAWFHDVGHLFGPMEMHEDKSISIMEDYLKGKAVESGLIKAIAECILATKLPHHPHSLLQEIICDADTYHLGTIDFIRSDALLKKEFQLRNVPIDNWEEKTLQLLLTHKYFAPYCQELLNKGKEKNIDLMRRTLKALKGKQ